jgi:hypothetical protein
MIFLRQFIEYIFEVREYCYYLRYLFLEDYVP